MTRVWCELSKRDGLIVVKWISSTVHQFYFKKILLILFLLIQIPCQILQIHLFFNKLSLQEFTQYAPVFFIMCYGILAAIILLTDPQLVENLYEEVKVTPIDCATGATKMKIKKEMRSISMFTIVNTILTVIALGICYVCTFYDYHTFLSIKYVADYWPEYLTIFTRIYKASFCILAPTVFLAHCYQVIYYTQHVKYQFWMLIDQISDITELEATVDVNVHLVDDLQYQTQVKCRLINLIERHVEIIIPIQRKIREISNYIVYFAFSGLLFLSSVAFLLFTAKTQPLYDFRYLPIICVVNLATFTAFMTAGQSMETVTENMYETLKQIDWYNMNVGNRKLYLILLACTQKKIKIRFSEKYSINHELGLATVRGAYSIMSVLIGCIKS